MALQIYKEPSANYPIHNDSFFQFGSTLSGHTKSTITLSENGSEIGEFIIYPNTFETYLFNFKDVVKSLIKIDGNNAGEFLVLNEYTPAGFVGGNSITLDAEIRVHNATTSEVSNKQYTFFNKSVQVGQTVFDNSNPILNYSEDGINFNLTYFEGYPFDFDIQSVDDGFGVFIKNLNSGVQSEPIESTGTGVFRFYVDSISENWSTSQYLPLSDNVNRLEIWEDLLNPQSNPIINLNLTKIDPKCGVYLKWENYQGGYSYWLFDEFTKSEMKVKDLESVGVNSVLNINDGIQSQSRLIGKKGKEILEVKSNIDESRYHFIQSLFTSPSVKMYTKTSPFQVGQWIDVNASGKYEYFNKRRNNRISVTLELPQIISTTL